jgi:hypothetical protein
MLFAAVHESAYGTKRTLPPCRTMSAFGGKADIDRGLSILDASLLISNQLAFLVKSLRGSDFSRPVDMQPAVWVHRGNTDDSLCRQSGLGEGGHHQKVSRDPR